MMGKLLIFSAPSGSGKTTIVRRLMERFPRLEFSVSVTSRPPRGAEVNGRDYHFVTPEEFGRLVEAGEFVEWEEVYEGTRYGTLRREVEGIWARENVCVFDVDVVGGVRLKQIFGDAALSFFVECPSMEELRGRLEARGTDSPESIERRLAKAEEEAKRAAEFDHVVVNDDLDRAVDEVATMVAPFIARRIMLYFGSFNPVHRGHVAVAEYAVEKELADLVVMVVSPQSPFKEAEELAPELERYEMAVQAAKESKYPDKIAASAVELTLPRPSYTIDTLRFLEAQFPGAELSLLVGGDNAPGMVKWKEAEAILGGFPVYVYPRPGDDEGAFPEGVTVLEGAPEMEISSTRVRELLAEGRERFREGDFAGAANSFGEAVGMAPVNREAAGYLHLISEIQNFKNTDLMNP